MRADHRAGDAGVVGTARTSGGMPGADPAVVDALDQLAELHENAQHLWSTWRALEVLALGRQERIGFAARWSDVAVAAQITGATSALLSRAGRDVDQVRARAVTAYLDGVLRTALALQSGRRPGREEVLDADPDPPLSWFRDLVSQLDPTRLAPHHSGEAERLAHRITAVTAAIDALDALDEPLATLLDTGYLPTDDLPGQLVGFTEALHDAVRPSPAPRIGT